MKLRVGGTVLATMKSVIGTGSFENKILNTSYTLLSSFSFLKILKIRISYNIRRYRGFSITVKVRVLSILKHVFVDVLEYVSWLPQLYSHRYMFCTL